MSLAAPKTRPSCLSFLKCLGQAAKDVSLYRSSHPIAVASLGKAFKAFESLFPSGAESEFILSLSDGRWVCDGADVAPISQGPEILKALYVNHGVRSLKFARDCRLYEFSALCELASIVPKNGEDGYLSEYLLQRGVKHIRPDNETYSRNPPPLPPASAPEPAPAPRRAGSERNFARLLRSLIESAVADPEERAHLYADALEMVKQSLERQVAESTQSLRMEKERVLREQGRAEKVLSSAAAGKVVVDDNGNVVMMNPVAEEIAGKSLVEIAGKPLSQAINPEEQMLTLSPDLKLRADVPLRDEIRTIGGSEVERSFKRSVAMVHDEAGRVVGAYATLPDVAKFKETRKMQEEFVSRVTHELRAPLTSISSALELLKERAGARLSPEEANFIAIGMRNSERLEAMIQEILDFSKLDSGEMQVSLAPLSLEPILSEAMEGLAPWAKTKGVAIAMLPIDPELPRVLADRTRVLQIVTNLLSNAIKSSAQDGKIAVSAARGKGEHFWNAIVSVRDTGCGIAPENLVRIFDKFAQLEDPGYRREGIGLGLSIVKELVRSHGGSVWVESRSGEGSTFHFTLPLAEGTWIQKT